MKPKHRPQWRAAVCYPIGHGPHEGFFPKMVSVTSYHSDVLYVQVIIFLICLVLIGYLMLWKGGVKRHDKQLSPARECVGQVYGREFDAAAPLADHYGADSGSTWHHQRKMAHSYLRYFGFNFVQWEEVETQLYWCMCVLFRQVLLSFVFILRL